MVSKRKDLVKDHNTLVGMKKKQALQVKKTARLEKVKAAALKAQAKANKKAVKKTPVKKHPQSKAIKVEKQAVHKDEKLEHNRL